MRHPALAVTVGERALHAEPHGRAVAGAVGERAAGRVDAEHCRRGAVGVATVAAAGPVRAAVDPAAVAGPLLVSQAGDDELDPARLRFVLLAAGLAPRTR